MHKRNYIQRDCKINCVKVHKNLRILKTQFITCKRKRSLRLRSIKKEDPGAISLGQGFIQQRRSLRTAPKRFFRSGFTSRVG
jgi:hypothetical protein